MVEDWAEIRRLHRAEGLAIRPIGTRIGAGLISGGRLRRGAQGSAGEIGTSGWSTTRRCR
jgi:predicted NBD/HSP70 family sugar kinase